MDNAFSTHGRKVQYLYIQKFARNLRERSYYKYLVVEEDNIKTHLKQDGRMGNGLMWFMMAIRNSGFPHKAGNIFSD
jgi:hypothetical protein